MGQLFLLFSLFHLTLTFFFFVCVAIATEDTASEHFMANS